MDRKIDKSCPNLVKRYESGEREIRVDAKEFEGYWDYLCYEKWDQKPTSLSLWDAKVMYG